jgi:hypothetical protein
MTGQLFSSSRLKLASCLFDGSCAVQVELSSRQISTNVVPVRRSRQKERSGEGEGVEERGEEEQGKEKRRKEKENKGGKRKGSQGKEKRRRKKEKQERGRKKQAAAISKQVGPQLPLGSMPSAHGGSLCFKGVAPCGEGEHALQPCVRWPKRRAARNWGSFFGPWKQKQRKKNIVENLEAYAYTFRTIFRKIDFRDLSKEKRLASGGPAPAGGGGSRGNSHRAERASTRTHAATQLPTMMPGIMSKSGNVWLVSFAIR